MLGTISVLFLVIQAMATEVPFVELSTPMRRIQWSWNSEEQRSTLSVDKRDILWPTNAVPTFTTDVGAAGTLLWGRTLFKSVNLVCVCNANYAVAELPLPAALRETQIRAVQEFAGVVYIVGFTPFARSTKIWKLQRLNEQFTFSEPLTIDVGLANFSLTALPRMVFDSNNLFVVGGSKVVAIGSNFASNSIASYNLPGNAVAYDCVLHNGIPLALAIRGGEFEDSGGCSSGCDPEFLLWNLKTKSEVILPVALRAPARLESVDGIGYLEFMHFDSAGVNRWLRDELKRGLGSGTLYFGVDNHDTYLCWAGVDVINSLIDILSEVSPLSTSPLFSSVRSDARRRLDLEVEMIDDLLSDLDRALAATRVSLSGRDPIKQAVMSARLLSALDRYRVEIENPVSLRNVESLRAAVESLDGHAEEFVPPGGGILPTYPYLRWRYGGPIDYDGVNLPFNMQNSWATALLDSSDLSNRRIGAKMLEFALTQSGLVSKEENSASGWPYWWGDAYNGWSASQNVSSNRPSFSGYKNLASVGYRSIDAGALLRAHRLGVVSLPENLLSFFARQIQVGTLYPQVALDLPTPPTLPAIHLIADSRGASAEDLRKMVWQIGLQSGVNPPDWNRDSDGDGFLDIEEAFLGTNPLAQTAGCSVVKTEIQNGKLILVWKAPNGGAFALEEASPESDTPFRWRPVATRIATEMEATFVIQMESSSSAFYRFRFLGPSLDVVN